MTLVNLTTKAEKLALKAENLSAFGGFNLLNVKRQLKEMLDLIGWYQIFDQYTKHDIDHIDSMLKIIDWLIPSTTQKIMSPADWLLIVLAIYLHDIGLLVTKTEYDSREKSGFRIFREELLTGTVESSYRAKIMQLNDDEAERFLYQEFIREKHARRVRAWIIGQAPHELGITDETMELVQDLLKPFDGQFRKDLAFICESHHLDDLHLIEKYRISRAYGDSKSETANLQYVAVMLRAADLLDFTRNRTPAIRFRLINPTDPISLHEWAKQTGVKAVRPKNESPRCTTIEVYGYFPKELAEGYFGLISYLDYARKELQKCHDWIEKTGKIYASDYPQIAQYEFPWCFLDESNVETDGFVPKKFAFTIEHRKIIELLSGHQLYDDTSVVLRELVQNSLDAVRLQHLLHPRSEPGKIEIGWNSKHGILSVKDNGTGMTLEVIEKHLLNIGASYYQDPNFKSQYSNFSPISRFGIGILSSFMVADTVEITTCHPDDNYVWQLHLRTGPEKYIVLSLEPTDVNASQVIPHGTLIRLQLREDANMPDVVEMARKWIIIPEHEVTIRVDDGESQMLGFPSPREALGEFLKSVGVDIDETTRGDNEKKVQVIQHERDGLTLAYAVAKSEDIREGTFLAPTSLNAPLEKITSLLGICVEGIHVEFGTPGFNGYNIIALANMKGLMAPRTNIARTSLEHSLERDEMLKSIYSIYCDHITYEIQDLYARRSSSITKATQEARYLLSPLLANVDNVQAADKRLLTDAIQKIHLLLLERDSSRRAVSLADVWREHEFWTIDCQLFQLAEELVKEIPGEASVSAFLSALKNISIQLPSPLLCGLDPTKPLDASVFAAKEVDKIVVYREQQRVDMRWVKKQRSARWYEASENTLAKRMMIALDDIESLGLLDEIAIHAFGSIYLLRSPVSRYLTAWLSRNNTYKKSKVLEFLCGLVQYLLGVGGNVASAERLIQNYLELEEVKIWKGTDFRLERSIDDLKELYTLVQSTNWQALNTSVWRTESNSVNTSQVR